MNDERYLSPAQRNSLADFCEANSVAQVDRDTLSRLTGRGYRPPITVEGWQGVYDMLAGLGYVGEEADENAVNTKKETEVFRVASKIH